MAFSCSSTSYEQHPTDGRYFQIEGQRVEHNGKKVR